MSRSVLLIVSLFLLVAIQGCSTKTYGRQGEVTSFEKESLTCREIDIEIAKTNGFISTVNKESSFSGRDVLAILGDFGIGNALERSAALDSATARLDKLGDLRVTRNCGAGVASISPTSVPRQNVQASQQAVAPPGPNQ